MLRKASGTKAERLAIINERPIPYMRKIMILNQDNLPIDLLPIGVFCDVYKKARGTVYSWRSRYPELLGVVFFDPQETEIHISIAGYEQWIRGELTQKEQDPTTQASRSNSGGRRGRRATSTKRSTGLLPQLT